MIHAEKVVLKTDAQGLLTPMPVLPPNCRIEAIFLVLDEPVSPAPLTERRPAPSIAGKGKTLGDLIAPIVPEDDWECLK